MAGQKAQFLSSLPRSHIKVIMPDETISMSTYRRIDDVIGKERERERCDMFNANNNVSFYFVYIRFLLASRKSTPLVGDDILLLGLGVLDLGTLVKDLFRLVVDDNSKTHILGQFDDVVEDLVGEKSP
jgi:hypothetical protein